MFQNVRNLLTPAAVAPCTTIDEEIVSWVPVVRSVSSQEGSLGTRDLSVWSYLFNVLPCGFSGGHSGFLSQAKTCVLGWANWLL